MDWPVHLPRAREGEGVVQFDSSLPDREGHLKITEDTYYTAVWFLLLWRSGRKYDYCKWSLQYWVREEATGGKKKELETMADIL